MSRDWEREAGTIGPESILLGEVPMVRRERWEEIRRLWVEERVPVAEIARRFELDRKTVRRCLKGVAWRPYQRPARADTLLAPHAEYLKERASQVGYSAQILYQELQPRGYWGSYETVKLFVRPLRAARLAAERALVRFETPPGLQSQIDWGTARIPFRRSAQVRHIFVLTLGFSRRGFYLPCLNETLPQFLDAHERAFEYFGGHTQEHLYDRPRTVTPSTGRTTASNPCFRIEPETVSLRRSAARLVCPEMCPRGPETHPKPAPASQRRKEKPLGKSASYRGASRPHEAYETRDLEGDSQERSRPV